MGKTTETDEVLAPAGDPVETEPTTGLRFIAWLLSTIAAITPDEFEEPKDGQEQLFEEIVGEMPTDLRALYTLWQRERRVVNRMITQETIALLEKQIIKLKSAAEAGENDEGEMQAPELVSSRASTELAIRQHRLEVIKDLFWHEIREAFGKYARDGNMAVRPEFRVVTWPDFPFGMRGDVVPPGMFTGGGSDGL